MSSSSIGEVVELVGSSDKSWEDAAQTAVKEAVKTIRNVHAIEVLDCQSRSKYRKYQRIQSRYKISIWC